MKSLKIIENQGQYSIVTTAGTRTFGASLHSAVSKFLIGEPAFKANVAAEVLEELLARVPDADGPSQIHQGQASA